MGLESNWRYIDDFNASWPLGGDPASQGDDHIRGIKTALQYQFPNLGDTIITPTGARLNALADYVTASGSVEDRLAALEQAHNQSGGGGWYDNSFDKNFTLVSGNITRIVPTQQYTLSGNENITVGPSIDGAIKPNYTSVNGLQLYCNLNIAREDLADGAEDFLYVGFADQDDFVYPGVTSVRVTNKRTLCTFSNVLPAGLASDRKFYIVAQPFGTGFTLTAYGAVFWSKWT